jgi:hypothetical protein
MIEQAARRGDDHVDAAAQSLDLGSEADASVDHRGARLEVPAVGAHALLDLRRELARGHEHQRLGMAMVERLALEDLQHRQREASGLPGAGLRGGEQVAAREDDGDGLGLDGGGLGVALLSDGAKQLGRKPEILERCFDETLLNSSE